MTPEEMDAFLEEGIEAHLPCLQPDGSPYAVVCAARLGREVRGPGYEEAFGPR